VAAPGWQLALISYNWERDTLVSVLSLATIKILFVTPIHVGYNNKRLLDTVLRISCDE